MEYTACRWIDDRCQHGYWVDDQVDVRFYPASTAKPGSASKYLCPKGQTTRKEGTV